MAWTSSLKSNSTSVLQEWIRFYSLQVVDRLKLVSLIPGESASNPLGGGCPVNVAWHMEWYFIIHIFLEKHQKLRYKENFLIYLAEEMHQKPIGFFLETSWNSTSKK